ncbi:hypothetical protein EZV62_007779 [Acer yangbiense]|uniref:Uncharacterized protein n=1 Tax=Acer yangbiense TaxID=1000413 RepID=A0A5C7IBI4_9ROSI|nr:hypothetical protein EZV62_007779 [Acer yangbiense]
MKFYKLSILPLPFTKIILFRQQPLHLLRFLSSLASISLALIRKQPFSFDFSRFEVEDPSISVSSRFLFSLGLALHSQKGIPQSLFSISVSFLCIAQPKEAAAMAVAQVAFVLQYG